MILSLKIASHARPSELLALARTNRILRQVLMSRKSETTWKAAREKIGGPECPPDLSEPFWADLLFGGMKCQVGNEIVLSRSVLIWDMRSSVPQVECSA